MDHAKRAYLSGGIRIYARRTHHAVGRGCAAALIAWPTLLRVLHTRSSACMAYKRPTGRLYDPADQLNIQA